MVERRITCITKDDRNNIYKRITHIGGEWGENEKPLLVTVDTAVEFMDAGLFSFYVEENGVRTEVEAVPAPNDKPYLRTVGDDEESNNLLNLPECS